MACFYPNLIDCGNFFENIKMKDWLCSIGLFFLWKALSPEMQAEIIKQDMTNCRSPSAVLLSRIEKLKAAYAHTGAPGRPVAPTVAPRRGGRILPTAAPQGPPGPPAPSPQLRGSATPQLRGSAARSRSPRAVPHPARSPPKEQSWNDWKDWKEESWEHPNTGNEMEDFIERYRLDERAAGQLRSLPPEELQQIVAGIFWIGMVVKIWISLAIFDGCSSCSPFSGQVL